MENIGKLADLRLVFDVVPPQRLKNHMVNLFLHYIATTEPSELESGTPEMAEDIKIFIEYLQKYNPD